MTRTINCCHFMASVFLMTSATTAAAQEPVILPVDDEKRVNSLAFSPTGTQLVAACGGFHGMLQNPAPGRVMVWSLPSGKLDASLKGHGDGVACVAYSPDGKVLASGGYDGRLQIRDSVTARDVATLDVEVGPLLSMAFSNDGRYLALGGWADDINVVAVFDLATRKIVKRFPPHENQVGAISFLFGDADVVTGSADGIINVWDFSKATLKQKFGGHSGTIYGLAVSPDGQLLAVASGDLVQALDEPPGELKVWNTATWKVRFKKTLPETPFTVAFTPDGTHLVVAGESESIRFVDLAGEEKHVLRSKSDSVRSVAFSIDGKFFASGGTAGSIELWKRSP